MNGSTIEPAVTPKVWETDPADRYGHSEPHDVAQWLGRHAEYRAQLGECQACPFLGRGALCAAEIPYPHPSAARIAMENCADTLKAGGRKPEHGARQAGVVAVSSIYKIPRQG